VLGTQGGVIKPPIMGGKMSFFCKLVFGSMVRKKLESILCREVEHFKNNF
jgi:hypothetical protein